MAEKVLILPNWMFSPGACNEVPALRALLAEVRQSFPVDVFEWPWFAGRSDVSWQAGVDALRGYFSGRAEEEQHVIATPSGSALMLAAQPIGGGWRSFVMGGVAASPATLRALNMRATADASMARLNDVMLTRKRSWSYQAMRPVLEGAAEEEIKRIVDRIETDIDRHQAFRYVDAFQHLDLLRKPVEVTVPTLYLQPSVPLAGFSEMQRVVRVLISHAEVEDVQIWPGELHRPESGEELATRALAFIQKHRVRADS